MKKTARSLGYSITGLRHALAHETNLRRFVLAQFVVFIAAAALGMDLLSMIVLALLAAGFIIVELLNTALERLADTFDDYEKQRNSGHYHPGIKMTKDVSAGASLIALILYGSILVLIFIPYIFLAAGWLTLS